MGDIIETERLMLRTWDDNDLQPIIAINQDPKVMEYFPSLQDVEMTKNFIDKVNAHFNARKSGFMTGMGFETSLSKHLGVTLEYDYIDYQSMEHSLNAIDFKYQPTETQFRLGLRYRF